MNDQDKMDTRLLYGFASGYACCLHSHFNTTSAGFDVAAWNYLTLQADYVRCNPEKCLRILRDYGARKEGDVNWKYLQYFFAMQPPLWDPYEELWQFVYSELLNEGKLTDMNVFQAFNRLLLLREHDQRLLYAARSQAN